MILGPLAIEDQGIREFREEKYFEFWIAGATKRYNDTELQPVHTQLHQTALQMHQGDEDALLNFPFGKHITNIAVSLIPEPTNKFDSNAILVRANIYDVGAEVDKLAKTGKASYEFVLGYVPKVINTILLGNFDRLRIGWVKKVRHRYSRYYSTKVAIPWSNIALIDRSHLQRAVNILE